MWPMHVRRVHHLPDRERRLPPLGLVAGEVLDVEAGDGELVGRRHRHRHARSCSADGRRRDLGQQLVGAEREVERPGDARQRDVRRHRAAPATPGQAVAVDHEALAGSRRSAGCSSRPRPWSDPAAPVAEISECPARASAAARRAARCRSRRTRWSARPTISDVGLHPHALEPFELVGRCRPGRAWPVVSVDRRRERRCRSTSR